MATCESLEAELSRLKTEASGLKNKIAALEAANKNNKNNNNNSSKTGNDSYDDTEIKARLKKLEDNLNVIIVPFLESLRPLLKAVSKLPLFNILIGGGE